MSPEIVKAVLDKATLLYSGEEVDQAIAKLADELAQDYDGKSPIIVPIMSGALMFAGTLMTKLQIPLELDYVHASRYGGNIEGGTEFTWKVRPSKKMKNRHIILLDDILDVGHTLDELQAEIMKMGAASCKTCVLVDKKHDRKARPDLKADYTGIETEDHFLIGYGMDYHGFMRNVNGIYAVAPEHYSLEG